MFSLFCAIDIVWFCGSNSVCQRTDIIAGSWLVFPLSKTVLIRKHQSKLIFREKQVSKDGTFKLAQSLFTLNFMFTCNNALIVNYYELLLSSRKASSSKRTGSFAKL